ncbi:unnamed protein product [Didymodactylos carnosus]|uniref:Uncharacterized protein n=1 Tax=Didymodactylos carnosus TaxID=1234261 RepID=A0A815W5U8_9BILA|nr:unnamed protein product [Didymodactylos carnosus]CAF4404169.1 unnamed protein product [Didymodactylos carnosus]
MRDLSKGSAKFLWFQKFKEVVMCISRGSRAKQQMIQFCRQYYHGNEKQLRSIDEFESGYTSDKTILWYTRDTFVTQNVNGKNVAVPVQIFVKST